LNLSEDLVHDWGNVERGRRGPHWQLAEEGLDKTPANR
jgi:hypothetical protein